MSIFIRKIAEDSLSYTLEWTRPAGENAGYRFSATGVTRRSHTWDTDRTTVRVSKGFDAYTVEALSVVNSGTWSPGATGLRLPPQFGVSPGASTPQWGGPLHTSVMNQLEDMFAGVRCAFRIDVYNFNSFLRRDIDACLQRNIVPYLIIGGTYRHSDLDPGQSAEYCDLANQIAEEYKDQDLVFTSSNEPDLNDWTPEEISDFYNDVYDAVKAADPNAPVGYAATFKGLDSDFPTWTEMIDGMIEGSGSRLADGGFVPFHGYDEPWYVLAAGGVWNLWHYWYEDYGTHTGETGEAKMAAAGLGDVPIISDECGPINNPSMTEADAAAELPGYLGKVTDGTTQGVYIFTVLDINDEWHANCKLFTPTGVPTLSYNVYKNFMESL